MPVAGGEALACPDKEPINRNAGSLSTPTLKKSLLARARNYNLMIQKNLYGFPQAARRQFYAPQHGANSA
jgi:hypothetical protein